MLAVEVVEHRRVVQVVQEVPVEVEQVVLMLLEFLDYQTQGAAEVAMEAHQLLAATVVLES
jgi:hypothetical protein